MIWIGIGCRRGVSKQMIETAIAQVFERHPFCETAIAGIATIDVKSTEPGLLEYCQDYDLDLCCFAADELQAIVIPNPSRSVAQFGTLSVAEAAALRAAGSKSLAVPKQIFEQKITIAIARIPLP